MFTKYNHNWIFYGQLRNDPVYQQTKKLKTSIWIESGSWESVSESRLKHLVVSNHCFWFFPLRLSSEKGILTNSAFQLLPAALAVPHDHEILYFFNSFFKISEVYAIFDLWLATYIKQLLDQIKWCDYHWTVNLPVNHSHIHD
jgi:hypothetical protein